MGESLFDWGDDAEARLKAGVGPAEVATPKVLTVAEVAGQVRRLLEGNYPDILVQGELSGGKLYAASGHFYANLKDESGALDVVMFRSSVDKLVAVLGKIPPDGTLVVARGKLSTKPGRSQFQLVITSMEPAGLGALMQQLEALKAKLAAEGLFEASRKKPLPVLPRLIGIVTSPQGAVIQDMLHRIAERCPRHVLLWPVAVQGASAAAEIVAAVEGFNRMEGRKRPDVLIVARGGGSFEDLMAFNSEAVARAVAGSTIPVVSGVGHEPDVTLCDFAADVRAPTPTGAAEYVVPVLAELVGQVEGRWERMGFMVRTRLGRAGERISALARLVPDPRRVVAFAAERMEFLVGRLRVASENVVAGPRERLEALERLMLAVGPEAPLARGYALVMGPAGQIVRGAGDAVGRVKLRFMDGEKMADVVD